MALRQLAGEQGQDVVDGLYAAADGVLGALKESQPFRDVMAHELMTNPPNLQGDQQSRELRSKLVRYLTGDLSGGADPTTAANLLSATATRELGSSRSESVQMYRRRMEVGKAVSGLPDDAAVDRLLRNEALEDTLRRDYTATALGARFNRGRYWGAKVLDDVKKQLSSDLQVSVGSLRQTLAEAEVDTDQRNEYESKIARWSEPKDALTKTIRLWVAEVEEAAAALRGLPEQSQNGPNPLVWDERYERAKAQLDEWPRIAGRGAVDRLLADADGILGPLAVSKRFRMVLAQWLGEHPGDWRGAQAVREELAGYLAGDPDIGVAVSGLPRGAFEAVKAEETRWQADRAGDQAEAAAPMVRGVGDDPGLRVISEVSSVKRTFADAGMALRQLADEQGQDVVDGLYAAADGVLGALKESQPFRDVMAHELMTNPPNPQGDQQSQELRSKLVRYLTGDLSGGADPTTADNLLSATATPISGDKKSEGQQMLVRRVAVALALSGLPDDAAVERVLRIEAHEEALRGSYNAVALGARFNRSKNWANKVVVEVKGQLISDLEAAVGSLRQILADAEADTDQRNEYEAKIRNWLNIHSQTKLKEIRSRAEQAVAAVQRLREQRRNNAIQELREIFEAADGGLERLKVLHGRDHVVVREFNLRFGGVQDDQMRDAVAHRLLTNGNQIWDAQAFLERLHQLKVAASAVIAGAGPEPGRELLSESAENVSGDAEIDDAESVFDEAERAELLQRLDRLRGDAEPSESHRSSGLREFGGRSARSDEEFLAGDLSESSVADVRGEIGRAREVGWSGDDELAARRIVHGTHDIEGLARGDAAVSLEDVVALVADKHHELGGDHQGQVVEFSRALAESLGTEGTGLSIRAGAGPEDQAAGRSGESSAAAELSELIGNANAGLDSMREQGLPVDQLRVEVQSSMGALGGHEGLRNVMAHYVLSHPGDGEGTVELNRKLRELAVRDWDERYERAQAQLDEWAGIAGRDAEAQLLADADGILGPLKVSEQFRVVLAQWLGEHPGDWRGAQAVRGELAGYLAGDPDFGVAVSGLPPGAFEEARAEETRWQADHGGNQAGVVAPMVRGVDDDPALRVISEVSSVRRTFADAGRALRQLADQQGQGVVDGLYAAADEVLGSLKESRPFRDVMAHELLTNPRDDQQVQDLRWKLVRYLSGDLGGGADLSAEDLLSATVAPGLGRSLSDAMQVYRRRVAVGKALSGLPDDAAVKRVLRNEALEDALHRDYTTADLGNRFNRSEDWGRKVFDDLKPQLIADLQAAVGSLRQILAEAATDPELRKEYEDKIAKWSDLKGVRVNTIRTRAKQAVAAVGWLRRTNATWELREIFTAADDGLAQLEALHGRDHVGRAFAYVDLYFGGMQDDQSRKAVAHRLLTNGGQIADAQAFLQRLHHLKLAAPEDQAAGRSGESSAAAELSELIGNANAGLDSMREQGLPVDQLMVEVQSSMGALGGHEGLRNVMAHHILSHPGDGEGTVELNRKLRELAVRDWDERYERAQAQLDEWDRIAGGGAVARLLADADGILGPLKVSERFRVVLAQWLGEHPGDWRGAQAVRGELAGYLAGDPDFGVAVSGLPPGAFEEARAEETRRQADHGGNQAEVVAPMVRGVDDDPALRVISEVVSVRRTFADAGRALRQLADQQGQGVVDGLYAAADEVLGSLKESQPFRDVMAHELMTNPRDAQQVQDLRSKLVRYLSGDLGGGPDLSAAEGLLSAAMAPLPGNARSEAMRTYLRRVAVGKTLSGLPDDVAVNWVLRKEAFADALREDYSKETLRARFNRGAEWTRKVLDDVRQQLRSDLVAAVGSLRQTLAEAEADTDQRNKYEAKIAKWSEPENEPANTIRRWVAEVEEAAAVLRGEREQSQNDPTPLRRDRAPMVRGVDDELEPSVIHRIDSVNRTFADAGMALRQLAKRTRSRCRGRFVRRRGRGLGGSQGVAALPGCDGTRVDDEPVEPAG